ncbi:MAG: hypothetical protein VW397_06710 [Candidatus Margulisiibacteriota bacterium]
MKLITKGIPRSQNHLNHRSFTQSIEASKLRYVHSRNVANDGGPFRIDDCTPIDFSRRLIDFSASPTTQFKHHITQTLVSIRDEVQTAQIQDAQIKDLIRNSFKLGLGGIELGSINPIRPIKTGNKVSEFQHKMNYFSRYLNEFCQSFQQSSKDVQDTIRNHDLRFLIMTSKHNEKTQERVDIFSDLQTQLWDRCQIRVMPAVVAYADENYGQKNSKMNLNESIESNQFFWDSLHKHQRPFEQTLYLYISGIVGVYHEGRQQYGVEFYAENTAKIIQSFSDFNVPFVPIFGDTCGLGTLADFKLLNDICNPKGIELHLHHNPELSLTNDFQRIFDILKLYSSLDHLHLHCGIFSGGSPFSGGTNGFGGNLWLPFFLSILLKSNLVTPELQTLEQKRLAFNQSIDAFLKTPISNQQKEVMLDALKNYHTGKSLPNNLCNPNSK